MARFSDTLTKPVRLAVVPLAIAVFGLSACGGGTDLQKKTLKFTERDTDYFSFVDAPPTTKLTADGPDKVSNGDQLTFSNDLLDGSRKDVGDSDITCVFTRTAGEPRRGLSAGRLDGSSTVCTGVMTVPGGSLTATVGGKAFADGAQQGASTRGSIVGGTGDYDGATGEFVSGGEPAVDTVHLFLPKK
jgi:hypothetical protein